MIETMKIFYCTVILQLLFQGIYCQGILDSLFFPNFFEEDDGTETWNSRSQSQPADTKTLISQDYDEDGENVFVSKEVQRLPNGYEKITKTSEVEMTDRMTGEIIRKKKIVDYLKYPNGTVVELPRGMIGSGDGGYSGSGVSPIIMLLFTAFAGDTAPWGITQSYI